MESTLRSDPEVLTDPNDLTDPKVPNDPKKIDVLDSFNTFDCHSEFLKASITAS